MMHRYTGGKNMRKSKSEFSFINLHYSFIHFFYWMCLVSCQSYAAFYLLDSGMTNTQIGLLLGIGGFLAARVFDTFHYTHLPESL